MMNTGTALAGVDPSTGRSSAPPTSETPALRGRLVGRGDSGSVSRGESRRACGEGRSHPRGSSSVPSSSKIASARSRAPARAGGIPGPRRSSAWLTRAFASSLRAPISSRIAMAASQVTGGRRRDPPPRGLAEQPLADALEVPVPTLAAVASTSSAAARARAVPPCAGSPRRARARRTRASSGGATVPNQSTASLSCAIPSPRSPALIKAVAVRAWSSRRRTGSETGPAPPRSIAGPVAMSPRWMWVEPVRHQPDDLEPEVVHRPARARARGDSTRGFAPTRPRALAAMLRPHSVRHAHQTLPRASKIASARSPASRASRRSPATT